MQDGTVTKKRKGKFLEEKEKDDGDDDDDDAIYSILWFLIREKKNRRNYIKLPTIYPAVIVTNFEILKIKKGV